jgi:hypothetical protein
LPVGNAARDARFNRRIGHPFEVASDGLCMDPFPLAGLLSRSADAMGDRAREARSPQNGLVAENFALFALLPGQGRLWGRFLLGRVG